METAKLILDYLKTLVWPIMVLLLVLLYRPDIKMLLQRNINLELPGAKLKINTGESDAKTTTKANMAPDVYFEFRTNDSQLYCSNRARQALKQQGFVEKDGDVGVKDTLYYGYSEDNVGVILCWESPRVAQIIVSGLNSQTAAERRTRLAAAFDDARP